MAERFRYPDTSGTPLWRRPAGGEIAASIERTNTVLLSDRPSTLLVHRSLSAAMPEVRRQPVSKCVSARLISDASNPNQHG
jgi:hypothetical protein